MKRSGVRIPLAPPPQKCSGSHKNRIKALLAKKKAPVFAPIVIDSPIQQEQENHVRVLDFLKKNRPEEAQMIIGVVNPKGVEYGGDVIRLNNPPRSLLSTEAYASAIAETGPFIDKAFSYSQNLV
jgi:hypothetical protein